MSETTVAMSVVGREPAAGHLTDHEGRAERSFGDSGIGGSHDRRDHDGFVGVGDDPVERATKTPPTTGS